MIEWQEPTEFLSMGPGPNPGGSKRKRRDVEEEPKKHSKFAKLIGIIKERET